jgi:hypothetical protein
VRMQSWPRLPHSKFAAKFEQRLRRTLAMHVKLNEIVKLSEAEPSHT